MDKRNSLSWTVKFTIDNTWIADGFNLTDERAKEMLAGDLTFAYNSEITAKVLEAPKPLAIAKLQGYSTAKEVIQEIKQATIN